MLVCELGVLGVARVTGGGALAVVHCYDDGSGRLEVLANLDVHLELGRRLVEVANLRDGLAANNRGQGHEARGSSSEMHLGREIRSLGKFDDVLGEMGFKNLKDGESGVLRFLALYTSPTRLPFVRAHLLVVFLLRFWLIYGPVNVPHVHAVLASAALLRTLINMWTLPTAGNTCTPEFFGRNRSRALAWEM